MKVRCINNEGFESALTKNKEYDVKRESDNTYVIISDKGIQTPFIKGRFKIVEEDNSKLQEYMEK